MCNIIPAIESIRNKTPVEDDALKFNSIQSDHANWVIPGKIMCGPYPWLDHKFNFHTSALADANMNAILRDGVNTFVCLQSEVDPHDTYGRHLPKTCKIMHFPMPNDHTPAPVAFIEHLTLLAHELKNGAVLYIHCAGGHGRTGLYVAALLMMCHDGMNARRALERTQYLHDQCRRKPDARCPHGCKSPVTYGQLEMVMRFEHFLWFCGFS